MVRGTKKRGTSSAHHEEEEHEVTLQSQTITEEQDVESTDQESLEYDHGSAAIQDESEDSNNTSTDSQQQQEEDQDEAMDGEPEDEQEAEEQERQLPANLRLNPNSGGKKGAIKKTGKKLGVNGGGVRKSTKGAVEGEKKLSERMEFLKRTGLGIPPSSVKSFLTDHLNRKKVRMQPASLFGCTKFVDWLLGEVIIQAATNAKERNSLLIAPEDISSALHSRDDDLREFFKDHILIGGGTQKNIPWNAIPKAVRARIEKRREAAAEAEAKTGRASA